jgi:hypothetical protein
MLDLIVQILALTGHKVKLWNMLMWTALLFLQEDSLEWLLEESKLKQV